MATRECATAAIVEIITDQESNVKEDHQHF